LCRDFTGVRTFLHKPIVVVGAVLKKIRLMAFIGMIVLAVAAFLDFRTRDANRMVITFYTVAGGRSLVEERLVNKIAHRYLSVEVADYVNEILLGPLSSGAAGFFPAATVQSCVVSDGTAYIGLTSSVALAGVKNIEDYLTVDTVRAFDTLKKDIRQNFHGLRNVVLFIEGREVVRGCLDNFVDFDENMILGS
jgi:hypothetical protein